MSVSRSSETPQNVSDEERNGIVRGERTHQLSGSRPGSTSAQIERLPTHTRGGGRPGKDAGCSFEEWKIGKEDPRLGDSDAHGPPTLRPSPDADAPAFLAATIVVKV